MLVKLLFGVKQSASLTFIVSDRPDRFKPCVVFILVVRQISLDSSCSVQQLTAAKYLSINSFIKFLGALVCAREPGALMFQLRGGQFPNRELTLDKVSVTFLLR